MSAVMKIERDPRHLNHMDPDTKEVHRRLTEWANWAHEIESQGLPTRWVTDRATEGGIGAGSPKPPVSMPDYIAVVDAAVARLGDMDKRAIKTYYLHWETLELSAKRMGMKTRRFQIILRRARWRIGGYLDAVNE